MTCLSCVSSVETREDGVLHAARVRVFEKVPSISPILRGGLNTQDAFQYLESREPILRYAPARQAKFWVFMPLENYKFIYAYEDATYCGELYQRLRQQLSLDGNLELAFALSQQRSPPVTLPSRHPAHRGPARVAVALVDSHEQLACFQCPSTGEYFLPHADVPRGLEEPSLLKDFAKAAWADCMGHPPKPLRAAINNRMRKGVRIGDIILYVCCTPDCGEALAALAGSRVACRGLSFQRRAWCDL